MNHLTPVYFICEICHEESWEAIKLCSTCSDIPEDKPYEDCCYSLAISKHNEKVHYSVDLV